MGYAKTKSDKNKLNSAEEISKRIIEDANKEAEATKRSYLGSQDEIFKLKQEIEEDDKERRSGA